MALVGAGCANTQLKKPAIEEQDLGRVSGQPVKRFTLTNRHGMSAKIISLGAILTELRVPDRNGKVTNVVHGFDDFQTYLGGHPFFGATTGRVANRIARARFTLDGQEYLLAANDGQNHLHGGIRGFDKALWQAKPVVVNDREVAVAFSYFSRDGEEGYPRQSRGAGRLHAHRQQRVAD